MKNNKSIQTLIQLALKEDSVKDDITTKALIDKYQKGTAKIIAKENLVLAGIEISKRVFHTISRQIRFYPKAKDGEFLKKGAIIAVINGQLVSILAGERTALNFLQRMSGIATLTRKFVDLVKPYSVQILDTRKTIPGWRLLDKYSVKVGGGKNHRIDLRNGILIKDNHIMASGGIKQAVLYAKKFASMGSKIEVETKNLREVEEALEAGADIIMLDNMDIKMMKKAVRMIGTKALTEASGGINLQNVRDIAKTGVNFISIGALTHSPRAVDISLEVE